MTRAQATGAGPGRGTLARATGAGFGRGPRARMSVCAESIHPSAGASLPSRLLPSFRVSVRPPSALPVGVGRAVNESELKRN